MSFRVVRLMNVMTAKKNQVATDSHTRPTWAVSSCLGGCDQHLVSVLGLRIEDWLTGDLFCNWLLVIIVNTSDQKQLITHLKLRACKPKTTTSCQQCLMVTHRSSNDDRQCAAMWLFIAQFQALSLLILPTRRTEHALRTENTLSMSGW